LADSDQDRCREFYRTLLDGVVVSERDPVIMATSSKLARRCWASPERSKGGLSEEAAQPVALA
jgi:hypothetical protein